MPWASPHVCPHPGCTRLAPRGKRCQGHEGAYQAQRAKAGAFYDRADWKRLRAAVLAAQPVCPGLPALGRGPCGARTTHVDHVVPRSRAPGRSLDPSNTVAYCRSCHSTKTCRVDGGLGVEGGGHHA